MWLSVKRCGVVLAAALVVSFAFGGPAFADRATELKAREDFAAGRYDEALQLFAKLYAETLHPVYLRNIGRCHQNLREPQKAIVAFRDYLTKNKKISDEERAEIEGYIHEMEAVRDEQAKQAAAAQGPSLAPAPTAVLPPFAPPPVSSSPAITLVLLRRFLPRRNRPSTPDGGSGPRWAWWSWAAWSAHWR